MQRWDEGFVGQAQRKRVHIHNNGDFEHGKVLYMEPDWDHLEFLNAASHRLEMVPAANRLFNADGVEIDDCMMIEDDDMLFLSINDDFIAPADFVPSDGEDHAEGEKIPHIIGGFKVTELLGRGGFGEVRVGEHSLTGERVALKFLRKSEILSLGAAERTNTEIQCLTALKHAHIIRLQHHMETQNHVVLVFELMQGGDLLQYLIKRKAKSGRPCLSEDEARHVFYQVLSGVSYAHNQHICHRDLKLENILLKDNTLAIVKIADFGLSDFYRPGAMIKSSCGTLSFLAPEVFKGTANAGPPLDVWSMGVILFALVCGRMPFEGPDLASSKRPRDAVIRSRIMKCQYKLDDSLSAECKDLIRRLLAMDPVERMTIPETFNHIWVRTTVPAHVIESYKYDHFMAGAAIPSATTTAPSAQVHPSATESSKALAPLLPLEALSRAQRRTPSDLAEPSTPAESTDFLSTSRRPSAAQLSQLDEMLSGKISVDPSPRQTGRMVSRSTPVAGADPSTIMTLSRENSDDAESSVDVPDPFQSVATETKPMIRLIPLRKEIRTEDSFRRPTVNDDDLSVISAASAGITGSAPRRESAARRADILNGHFDHARSATSSPMPRALDQEKDSLYELMTPPRSAQNSPNHEALNLTEIARHRNSLTKGKDTPSYMSEKGGRHHVALAGAASISGSKGITYNGTGTESGSSTARSRAPSQVGNKPRFGV